MNILTWCEIPVTDMSRAKTFYSEVFDIKFIDQNMDDMQMAMFESETAMDASGALVRADRYEPSRTATVPYLMAGSDLNGALAKANGLGSEVVVPKTEIDGGAGYFAQFIDCEGNRVGLFSLS